jgi:hypothetical protein
MENGGPGIVTLATLRRRPGERRDNEPIDEGLPRVLFHLRMLLGIHQHDTVSIEQALVAFDHDVEVTAMLERNPGAAIRQTSASIALAMLSAAPCPARLTRPRK